MLQALSTGCPIECEAFYLYVKDTTVLYLQKPQASVFKILTSGAKIIEASVRHVGKVPEETQEPETMSIYAENSSLDSSSD
jgi:hypothetical protein